MISRLRTWHGGLTPRERLLVDIAGVLTALVVLVYGIVLPVGRAFDAAALRLDTALVRSGRLMAQIDALKRPAAGSTAAAGPVDQRIAASAEAAGLVLQSNQARGADSAEIALPAARGPAVLAWIDGLAAQGIAVDTLTVTPGADGSVSVNAVLRRAGR